MTAPVQDAGRWWSEGQRLPDDERTALLATLVDQVQGSFPPATEVYRSFLSCYPRHALLRFELPSEAGLRTSFAFYAGGQLYPLDWRGSTLRDFAEVALDLSTESQAASYLRFVTSAIDGGSGRTFVVEDVGELRLRPRVWLEREDEVRIEQVLHPVESIPVEGEEEAFRFRCSLLHAGTVYRVEIGVTSAGLFQSRVDESVESVDVPVVEESLDSDTQVVLVRETSLTAERFLRRVRSGPLHQARVTEPVHLRGEVFPDPVSLSQVTFERGADFSGARFEKGLALEQCVFEGKLDLRDAHVEGSFDAPGLRFHREGRGKDEDALVKATPWGSMRVDLDGSGLRVEGSCAMERLRTAHAVDLSHARIEGDLRLGGSEIGERAPRGVGDLPSSAILVRLDGASVGGNVDLAWGGGGHPMGHPDPADRAFEEHIPGYSTPYTIVRGSIQANTLAVGGDIALTGLRCEGDAMFGGARTQGYVSAEATAPENRPVILGSLWLNAVHIAGHVGLSGLYVGGSLEFFQAEVGGLVVGRTSGTHWGRLPPLHVVGQLDLSGTRAPDVELSGAEIGELRIVTGELGRLRVVPGFEPALSAGAAASPGDAQAPFTGRPIRVRPTRIGSVALWDLTVRKRLVLRAEVREGIDLGNIDCGGDLEFWSDHQTRKSLDRELAADEGWADGEPRIAAAERTRVGADLRCVGIDISGRLVLTNLDVDGRILFKNCQVGQDLNCSSVGPDPRAPKGRTRTRCGHLDLELTTCGGDVDLAGLEIVDGGSLHARQLQVAGRILFARALGGAADPTGAVPVDPAARVQARITGDVDLSVARAGQLVLTGSSIGGRVNLERGTFQRLDVVEALELAGHDLSDVVVDRWEIPDEHLVAFLDHSEPFARATYVAIERMLRNKAQDADADRVYRAMRARAIVEVRKGRQAAASVATAAPSATGHDGWWPRLMAPVSYFLRTSGARAQGWLYGWGTLYWVPLFVFSLLTVPVTWWMFSSDDNVTPSLELMASAGVPTEGAVPGDVGVEWGPSDGFWLTVRYHVPVIPLAAREEFRPAPRPAVLPLPGASVVRFLFSAEGYAFAVYLLSWILWPLFLVGLGRRIVRETT